MSAPELIVCSHRGPYVYRQEGDRLVSQRGGGGLISAMAPVLDRFGGVWIAAAMSPADRRLASSEPEGRDEGGFHLQLLALPRDAHALHYDVVSNEYLWFTFHYLFDIPEQPLFGRDFADAWAGYRTVNEAYADAVAARSAPDAVLVEDYHLMLVGRALRDRGVAVPTVYFHHTPWCEPDYFSVWPEPLRREILEAMLAYDVVGFHARRWAHAFAACCQRYLPGCTSDGDRVAWDGHETSLVVAPVPIDAADLREQAASDRTERWVEKLEGERHDRRMLTRIDRIDLSKNPLRGYLAFEALLDRRPELASDVWFLALQYPSRLKVDRYRRYFARCLEVVQRVNERYRERAPGDEGPLGLHFQDDFNQSLAAMRMFDAVLVNPVFDGLNLVSKESALLNERDGVVLLSRNAGGAEEIGPGTVPLDPFDVSATADVIERALEMPGAERRELATKARELATATDAESWVRHRLGAAGITL